MQVTAQIIAQLIQGTVDGNPDVVLTHPSKIEEGGVASITFLGNLKYESHIYTTTASAVIVSNDFTPKSAITPTLIRVADVYAALSVLLEQFGQQNNQAQRKVSEQAVIASNATIGQNVHLGALSVVKAGAVIGDDCTIYEQVYIGDQVKLGRNVTLYPGVRIYHACELGDNCIIHANVVIGSDGFGFAPQKDGSYKKIPQVGNVLIEADVEIGANTAVDRATMGSTIIRRGVKLDNLIQVAHNVEIDEDTVIAAHTGIAGSTKIGKRCMIGGQVGFVGHIKIADNTKIQAQSGVASHIKEENQSLFGSPAFAYKNYVRSYGVFKRLPTIDRTIHRLEKELAALKEQIAEKNHK